jgi:hypothetical protein
MITTRSAILSVTLLVMACGKVEHYTDAAGDDDGIDGAAGDPDAANGPFLTLSPLSHGFGPVLVSSISSSTAFTFTNSGTATATGCSAPTKGGANPDDFTIATDNCGTSDLIAGGSCTVLLTASPTTIGLRTMTLSRTCTEGGTAASAADEIIVNRPMHVFITSMSYTGALGGLDGADAICNALGTGGTLSGPLNTTWKALLSKTTGGVVNAADRFVWTGPMYDLAGHVVTWDPSTWPWVNAGDNSNIGVNENGGGPDDSYVWTGSTLDGVTQGGDNDCNSWTDGTSSFHGWSGETSNYPTSSWITSFSNTCDAMWFGLYCISE